jgi:hypothetical protein
VKKFLVVAVAGALAITLAHVQAQGRGGRGGRDAPGRGDGREAQSGVVEDNGGIRYINPGSPTMPRSTAIRFRGCLTVTSI